MAMRTMAKVPATASAKQAKHIATTVGIFAPAGVEIDLVRINPRVLPGVRIVAIDLNFFTRVASAGMPSLSAFDARLARYIEIPRQPEPLQHDDARELI
jgi:hypothetical protein